MVERNPAVRELTRSSRAMRLSRERPGGGGKRKKSGWSEGFIEWFYW